MLRKFVGFAALTLAGAVLLVPDATFARGGGGGFRGGFHAGGLRAPFMIRHNPRAGLLRAPHAVGIRQIGPFPAGTHLTHGPTRTHVASPFSHLERRHHHRFINNGWIYPITIGDDASYIGTPYDPDETIPVYAPPAITETDPIADPPAPRLVPRLSSARDENQDACRSERVTVPAGEGDREITVVR